MEDDKEWSSNRYDRQEHHRGYMKRHYMVSLNDGIEWQPIGYTVESINFSELYSD